MKFFTHLVVTTCCLVFLNACKPETSTRVKIGIIEPLEHTAMNEIVAGFKETFQKIYHEPVTITVENAQNDANLQRAIIQKMRDANDTIIIPIGMGTTQMSLAMVHDQAIVSLAAEISDKDRQNLKKCNVAVVHDQISSEQLLQFIHAAYPGLTQLSLIHSSADKVFPEVEETIAAGKKYGITVRHIMVSSLPELYAAASAIPKETQGIFILKDSMIVIGISTLAKIAAEKHIPLIASDQGSVENGAGISLGVHEKDIGVEGAKLAAAVLQGKSICELPIVEMTKLTVFINPNSLQQEGQSIAAIQAAANSLTYQSENVDTRG
jgi:putative ABC transport system substrate-binding protein